MGRKLKTYLRWILLVFGVVCLFISMYRFIQNAGGDESYDHAAEIAFGGAHSQQEQGSRPQMTIPVENQPEYMWAPAPVEEEDEHMALLADIDLEALQEVNPEVVGWVMIPDTKINYPILQGEDNEFYLKHTWEKLPNPMGSVFLEHRNDPDFTDFNTIVYAHNMNNGSMFADLKDFSARWFREEHPYIYIVNCQGVFRYDVFSFFKAPIDSPIYGLAFNQLETRETFIQTALEKSYADMGVVPEISDRIVTLSTCTGGTHDNRWVVLGRLKMIVVEKKK